MSKHYVATMTKPSEGEIYSEHFDLEDGESPVELNQRAISYCINSLWLGWNVICIDDSSLIVFCATAPGNEPTL